MRRLAVFVGLLLLLATLSPVSAFSSKGGGSYYHPYPTGLIPGDIVIGHNPTSAIVIPGYWTHTGLVAYYDNSAGDWVIIEATFEGVVLTTLRDFLSRYDAVAVLRVKTTDTIRWNAVVFAYQRLGKPYDYAWYTKQVYGDKYYCSELVWAAYKANGVDVDANPGWTLKYLGGVAPQEIYDDSDTYVIYYHSDS